MLGQPRMVLEGDVTELQAAHRKGLGRELTITPCVHAMFSTGNDEANRRVFMEEDADSLNRVGLAVQVSKKALDKAIKGLSLNA